VYFIVYIFNRVVATEASIYGMPFEKWGDPETAYKLVYMVNGDVKDNPITDAPENRLGSKAKMSRFRRAGTFWVRDLSRSYCNLIAILC
jgi:hypothetical protein